jgi:hypothetical protein
MIIEHSNKDVNHAKTSNVVESDPSSKVMLSLSDEQLNTLIRKVTSDIYQQIKDESHENKMPIVNVDAKQITLRDFVSLHATDMNIDLGKAVINAFLNSDPNSVLYQEFYDAFFKYRVGETLIRFVLDISNVKRWNYKKEFQKCVALSDTMFETIGTIMKTNFLPSAYDDSNP